MSLRNARKKIFSDPRGVLDTRHLRLFFEGKIQSPGFIYFVVIVYFCSVFFVVLGSMILFFFFFLGIKLYFTGMVESVNMNVQF